MSTDAKLRTVICPEPMKPLFSEAERIMDSFFGDIQRVPGAATSRSAAFAIC